MRHDLPSEGSEWLRQDAGPRPLVWGLSLLPVALIFLAAILQMRTDWTYDETYHYGWVVPALTGYLISVRWRDRPAPDPNPTRGRGGWVVAGLMLMAVWLVREANADWRPIAIGLTATAIFTSWLWLGEWGGRPWQRHFTGAVAFFAVSVPWPTLIESRVTDTLMPTNALLALEALHWLGVQAVRSGNLITLPEGTLGVEEACSGIRSLQATLMMALFLGELYRLRGRARGLLVGIGVGVALLTNALRTVILSAVAARTGLAEATDWHDRIGIAVLVVHAIALFWCAFRLIRSNESDGVTIGTGPFPAPPIRGPMSLLIAIAITWPVTYAWYRRSSAAEVPSAWKLLPPTDALEFTPVAVPGPTMLTLRYDDGWAARWRSPQGHQFHAFYFEWRPGTVRVGNLASHRPEYCLQKTGAVMESESPNGIEVEVADRELPIRFLKFRDRGRPLYVAFLVEEVSALDSMSKHAEPVTINRRRIEAVLNGCRNEGQRFLEVGLWGASSEAEARQLLEGFLRDHLKATPSQLR